MRSVPAVGLFPQMAPMAFTIKHFKFLELCLRHKEGILQKNIMKKLKMDKTTVSQTKSDLITQGWCRDVNLGSGKEILVKLSRLNDIKLFLDQWKKVGQTIFIRPHDINAWCYFLENNDSYPNALDAFTRKSNCAAIISQMNNNRQYTITTEQGIIIMHRHGENLQLRADGFILPLRHEDICNLGYYITAGITERLISMHTFLHEHFKPFKILIGHIVVMRKLSTGIIVKDNISKAMGLSCAMKKLGLYRDYSISGCHEFEISGTIDKVLEKVKDGANLLFKHLEEHDEND